MSAAYARAVLRWHAAALVRSANAPEEVSRVD